MLLVEPSIQMWLTLALTAGAILAYATERLSVELVAIGTLGSLMLMFHLTYLFSSDPAPMLTTDDLLLGFASPALIAVTALLVIGQAMINTGVLNSIANLLVHLGRGNFHRALAMSLASIAALSGFLNNTPIVVLFIPVLRAIAERFRHRTSAVMMPLSFAAILGGSTTLIGSSTNLLVAGEWTKQGLPPIGFFDMTVPGTVIALAGLVYVLLMPRFLPDRSQLAAATEARQFIAELDIDASSALIGSASRNGMFTGLETITVRLVQRGDQVLLPPFDNVRLQNQDVLIVAATRQRLTELLSTHAGKLLTPSDTDGQVLPTAGPHKDLILVEAMVTPGSRMIGQSIDLTNFPARSQCAVLGIQRRARMVRTRLGELRLEAGDVLLLIGQREAIERLRTDQDVLLMEWSAADMPSVDRGPVAALIFLGVVLPAAFDLVPITITAILGVVALIVTGCLNIRQAARAVDRRIVLVIASSLALGTALEATGGAAYIARLVLLSMEGAAPWAVLSVFFLLIAMLTNILSNNACAVLFTPIASSLGSGLGVDPFPFALAVIFASSCSFASPIGYQTNLLVMGPGHYRFIDFILYGMPLILLVWLTFSLFVPWYYGL